MPGSLAARRALAIAALALPLILTTATADAAARTPRLGVVYDCAFPKTIVPDDYEQGGIVFRAHGRYRYGTKVAHRRLAGKIRSGRYAVSGTYYDKPAIRFLSGPRILRPERDDGAKSFFDPHRLDYVGIYAANAIDLPWDCYQVGSRAWRDRERDERGG